MDPVPPPAIPSMIRKVSILPIQRTLMSREEEIISTNQALELKMKDSSEQIWVSLASNEIE